MAFSNDVVGGTTLLRPAIRSPNYVAGISGWTINKDGTSEFAGGTFRGPVIVIDPATGNVLASIGANGNGSFQSVYATNDVIIGNLSVLAAITQQARGVVGYFRTTGAVANIPGGNVFADILWCSFAMDSTRQYRASCFGGRINNTNVSNSEDYFSRLVIAQTGGASGVFGNGVSTTAPNTLAGIQCSGFISSSVTGPATVKLQMANDSASTAYPIITTDGMTIVVEDVGPKITGNGGTGTPAGAQQFTKQYFASASQVYDSSFNSESDPNNLYIGQLAGRSHGSNENSLWCFPGSTIRSDISGATIQSARLYMYCTGSSTTDGSVFLSWMTNTTPPASIGAGGSGGSNRLSVWPSVPSWAFVDISADLPAQIVANSMNAAYLQKTGLTGSCSWYGAGNATFKPYIQITYTV